MTQNTSVWLLIVVALLLANVPFISPRLLGFIPLKHAKSFALRLLELVLAYAVSGALGFFLEQRQGQIASQDWAFYAITAPLFITFAFPGFVWRYLLKRGT